MNERTLDPAEANRLANLALYDILDSLPEQQYDDLTQLAAHICQTPISLITFIDQDRQWLKSRYNFAPLQTARAVSFCTHAIQHPHQLLLIPDATQDERFVANPLVQDKPRLMFYAGVPIVTPEGYALGTLCVIDTKPNDLSPTQQQALRALARQVVALLTLRKKTAALEQAQQQQAQQLHELQQMSQQLHTALAKERELSLLKSAFVNLVSHEFRTPLTTIATSTDLIQGYLGKLRRVALAPFQRHIGIIKAEIKRFTALLDEVLISSQLDAGTLRFTPAPMDIVAFCEELIAIHFAHRPDRRLVELVVEGEAVQVSLDAYLITHIVVNLLTNAFKFSQRPIQLKLRFEPAEISLEVIDQGIGIPQQALAYIFDAFYRASNASLIEGTGLGLSITRQFVALHGGHIHIRSQEHHGTTVSVRLPVKGEPLTKGLLRS